MLYPDLLQIVCQYVDDLDLLYLSHVNRTLNQAMMVVLFRAHFRQHRIQTNTRYPSFVIEWLLKLDRWLITHITLRTFEFPAKDNYALPTGEIVVQEKVYDIGAKKIIYISATRVEETYVVYIDRLDQLMLGLRFIDEWTFVQLTTPLVAHYTRTCNIHMCDGDQCGIFISEDGTVSILSSFHELDVLITHDAILSETFWEPETLPGTDFFICPSSSTSDHTCFAKKSLCVIGKVHIDTFELTFNQNMKTPLTVPRGGRMYYQALANRVQQYLDKY